MILYKDTVSEQFRSFVTRSESDSNNNNSNNNNNNPAPETNSHASSSNSTSSSNSSNFPITILPQPIDPPSSRMRNTNIVGLEQIMVNQDDSLESKKYRHYFSRVKIFIAINLKIKFLFTIFRCIVGHQNVLHCPLIWSTQFSNRRINQQSLTKN